MKLFISGNRSIIEPSDKALDKLDEICVKHNISEDTVIILGDASGIDSFFQGIDWKNVIVYYSGKAPRNNVGNYPTNYVQAVGCGRAWHTCKDVAMSTHCDIHIGFVDTSKAGWQTSGTAANHNRVTNMGKPSYLIHI